MRTALTALFRGPAGPRRTALRSARSAALAACCAAAFASTPTPLAAQTGESSSGAASSEQPPAPPTSERSLEHLLANSATGVILPNRPIAADLELTAERTTAWQRDGTRHVLLERNVKIAIGAYGFRAKRAVVMLSPHALPGQKARHVAVYLDEVTELG